MRVLQWLAVQVRAEVSSFLKMLGEVYAVFGLEYSLALSTRPEGYLGELELWDKAEKALEESLNDSGAAPPCTQCTAAPHLPLGLCRTHACGLQHLYDCVASIALPVGEHRAQLELSLRIDRGKCASCVSCATRSIQHPWFQHTCTLPRGWLASGLTRMHIPRPAVLCGMPLRSRGVEAHSRNAPPAQTSRPLQPCRESYNADGRGHAWRWRPWSIAPLHCCV